MVGLVTTDVSEPRCQNQMLLLVPSQVLSHVPAGSNWTSGGSEVLVSSEQFKA